MKPIPWRERMVVRLASGMISVALLSMVLTFTLPFMVVTLTDVRPPAMRERLERLLENNPENEELAALAEVPFTIQRIMLRAGLVSLLISGGLYILFAVRFARAVTRPVEDVTLAAAQITQGDLSTRVGTSAGVKGEPAQLLKHFDQMADALETYERERSEMIASIAHELRTPLSVLRARLELLEEGIVKLDSDEVIRLSRQTALLTRLVEDLRVLSLSDAGRLSLNLAEIRLDVVISSAASALAPKFAEAEVTLHTGLDTLTAPVDADRVAQMVLNLLGNALKHSSPGDRVTLSLKRRGEVAELTIKDEGGGFIGPAEKLFQRFYTGPGEPGSGIGLALVKTLAEAHGGTVKAENGAKGAVFSIRLPLNQRL